MPVRRRSLACVHRSGYNEDWVSWALPPFDASMRADREDKSREEGRSVGLRHLPSCKKTTTLFVLRNSVCLSLLQSAGGSSAEAFRDPVRRCHPWSAPSLSG